MLVLDFL